MAAPTGDRVVDELVRLGVEALARRAISGAEPLYVGGASRIVGEQDAFATAERASRLLEMLEQQVVVVSLVRDLLDQGVDRQHRVRERRRRAARLLTRARALQRRRTDGRHGRRARPDPDGLPAGAGCGGRGVAAARPAPARLTRSMPSDPYALLGVASNATDDEIKRAYRAAGARAASGREPGEPRGRGAVQGDHGRVRDAARSRAPTTLRHVRRRRARRPRARARARPSGSATSSTPSSRASFGGGGSSGPPRAPDAEAIMELDLARGCVRDHGDARAPAPEQLRPLRRFRLRAGYAPDSVRLLRRRGRGAPGSAVDPRAARHRGALRGMRRHRLSASRTRARRCGGDGRVRSDAPHRGRGPGRHRRRAAAPADRVAVRPRRATASPAISTSRCACARTRRSNGTDTTSSTSAGSR